MIINVDRKARSIQLSIKAKDNADQQEAMQRPVETASARTPARPAWAPCCAPSSTTEEPGLSSTPDWAAERPGAPTMTRSDLVVQLADRFGQLTHRDTEFAVKTILDAMASALARGHRIEIRGFGSFSINRRPPRVGRNPRSASRSRSPRSWCLTSSRARPFAKRSTPASAPCAASRNRPRARPAPRRQRESAATHCDAPPRLARPGRRLLHALRLRAEQPARVEHPLVLRPGMARADGLHRPRRLRLRLRLGIFAMVPSWWRHRRIARREVARAPAPPAAPPMASGGAESTLPHPPRDGL